MDRSPSTSTPPAGTQPARVSEPAELRPLTLPRCTVPDELRARWGPWRAHNCCRNVLGGRAPAGTALVVRSCRTPQDPNLSDFTDTFSQESIPAPDTRELQLTHEENEHSRSDDPRPSSGRGSGDDRPGAASHSGTDEPNQGNVSDEQGLDADSERDHPVGVDAPIELDPKSDDLEEAQLAEVVDEIGPELVHRLKESVLLEARQSWNAPMPRPDDLAAYEATLPGSADRILSMAERALDSQIATDSTLATGDVKAIARGQWLYAVIAALSLTLGFVALISGASPWAAAAIASPAVLQFAGALVRTVREPTKPKLADEAPQPPSLHESDHKNNGT